MNARTRFFRRFRIQMLKRDGYKCLKCGSEKNLTIDHIIPKSRGGPNTLWNFQTLCKTCNVAKGAKIATYAKYHSAQERGELDAALVKWRRKDFPEELRAQLLTAGNLICTMGIEFKRLFEIACFTRKQLLVRRAQYEKSKAVRNSIIYYEIQKLYRDLRQLKSRCLKLFDCLLYHLSREEYFKFVKYSRASQFRPHLLKPLKQHFCKSRSEAKKRALRKQIRRIQNNQAKDNRHLQDIRCGVLCAIGTEVDPVLRKKQRPFVLSVFI